MRSAYPRPFGWWLSQYGKSVGSSDCRFGEFEELFYDQTRGFMCWELLDHGHTLYITKVCGDGRYWRNRAYEMFRTGKTHYGLKTLRCCTRHDPTAFMRLFGGSLDKVEERDGKPLYWIKITNTEAI